MTLSRCEPRSLKQSCLECFPACLPLSPSPAPARAVIPSAVVSWVLTQPYPTKLHLTKTFEVSSRLGLAFRMKTKESPLWPSHDLRSSLIYSSSRIFCLVLSCIVTSTQIIFPSSSRSCPFSSARGYFRAPGEEAPHFLTRSDPNIVGNSRLSPTALVSVAALCLFTVFDSCRFWLNWKLQEGRSQCLFPLEYPWHLTKGLVPNCCLRNTCMKVSWKAFPVMLAAVRDHRDGQRPTLLSLSPQLTAEGRVRRGAQVLS